jgi:hypothetical protein
MTALGDDEDPLARVSLTIVFAAWNSSPAH